ncbi:MAG: hypothetical protein IJB00_01915 [Akkermansia sp.]|nr:hypothetical protein [Akkermansia sp.]
MYKKKDVPTGHPFFVYAVAALIPAPSSSEPARQAARLRLKSPVGFSDPGGADTSAPFTPATPGPGGGRGFLLAPSGASRFTAVVVEPYGIPTTDSIPLNTRVGFSGEMKQD